MPSLALCSPALSDSWWIKARCCFDRVGGKESNHGGVGRRGGGGGVGGVGVGGRVVVAVPPLQLCGCKPLPTAAAGSEAPRSPRPAVAAAAGASGSSFLGGPSGRGGGSCWPQAPPAAAAGGACARASHDSAWTSCGWLMSGGMRSQRVTGWQAPDAPDCSTPVGGPALPPPGCSLAAAAADMPPPPAGSSRVTGNGGSDRAATTPSAHSSLTWRCRAGRVKLLCRSETLLLQPPPPSFGVGSGATAPKHTQDYP